MPIDLYRIDDRLIHGQVVVGWAQPLATQVIVVVDDAVAMSDWERELYRAGVSQDIEVLFATVQDACKLLPRVAADPRHSMVLTGDIATMIRLRGCYSSFERVNLGGIHAGPGRRQLLRYIYLSPDEEQALRSLAASGVNVTAQDVPVARAIPLLELLGETDVAR